MAKVKAKFRVVCTSKTEGLLFNRPFKGADTPKQAIKLARAYWRKKGFIAQDTKFTVEGV